MLVGKILVRSYLLDWAMNKYPAENPSLVCLATKKTGKVAGTLLSASNVSGIFQLPYDWSELRNCLTTYLLFSEEQPVYNVALVTVIQKLFPTISTYQLGQMVLFFFFLFSWWLVHVVSPSWIFQQGMNVSWFHLPHSHYLQSPEYKFMFVSNQNKYC